VQSRDELYKRFQTAKGNWFNWRSLYDEAYAFTCPQRNPWPDEQIPGRRKNLFVFDTTAVSASKRLVSRLHGTIMPPNEDWFELTASEQVPLSQKDEFNRNLSVINEILYKSIGKSNFDLVANEALQDLIIGTSAMMILEDDSEDSDFRCKSIPLNRIYPEGDAFDEIETVWREVINMRAHDIESFWPKAVLPESMLNSLYHDECVEYDLIEGIIYIREQQCYRHVVICEAVNDYILDEMEESTPWIVARWSKSPQEVGGRGPVIDALPTIRSLNRLVEYILENVALSTCPPWVAASDGVFNPHLFEIAPNSVIPVSRQSMGGLPLQKLDVSGDINLGTMEVNDLRTQIKEMLFDNPIRPVDGPQQTATEVSIRHQTFLEEIGPAWGRLSNEFLPKIIKRIIFILQKKGKLPKQFKLHSDYITIRYKSPLEQGKAFQDVQNLLQYLQIMNQNFGPQVTLGSLNLPILPSWLANKLDVDPILVKTTAEVAGVLQAAQQQLQGNQQQQQLTQAPNMAQQGAQAQMQQMPNPSQ
jgi:hypothetical protein